MAELGFAEADVESVRDHCERVMEEMYTALLGEH